MKKTIILPALGLSVLLTLPAAACTNEVKADVYQSQEVVTIAHKWYEKYFTSEGEIKLPENNNTYEDSNSNIDDSYLQDDEDYIEKDDTVQSENTSVANRVLNLVNRERVKAGLSPLTLDSSLSAVAQMHSEDMAKNNYFSHTNLNGLSPFDRIKNYGISYKTAGENIAMGYKDAQSVVEGWMNSQGHRENILKSSFGKMGLGCQKGSNGKLYWTQVFTD